MGGRSGRKGAHAAGGARLLPPAALCSSASRASFGPSEGERPPSRTCGGTSPSHESAGDGPPVDSDDDEATSVSSSTLFLRSRMPQMESSRAGQTRDQKFWPPRIITCGLHALRSGGRALDLWR